jgi:hypothetical protein
MLTPKDRQRTELQNNALHLWCTQVAEALNAGGVPYKLLVSDMNITHTMESTKSLFKLILDAKFRVTSTSQMTSKQCVEVFEDLNAILATKGIHIPWPSNEPDIFEENN